MRNCQRLGILGAAAFGLFGLVGTAAAADLAPGEAYYPPPRYAVPVERPVYAQRRHVEVQDDGECRYIVRRSVDPDGYERTRRIQDCDEGRRDRYGHREYDEEVEPYAAPPRPPVPVDPDDAY